MSEYDVVKEPVMSEDTELPLLSIYSVQSLTFCPCAEAFAAPPPPAQASSSQMPLSAPCWHMRAVEKSQTDGAGSPGGRTGVPQRLLHHRSNHTHINTYL